MPIFTHIHDRDTSKTITGGFQEFQNSFPLSNSLKPSSNFDFHSRINAPTFIRTSMPDHSDDKVGGDVIDHPGDEGATMDPEAEDRTTVEVIVGESAATASGGNARAA